MLTTFSNLCKTVERLNVPYGNTRNAPIEEDIRLETEAQAVRLLQHADLTKTADVWIARAAPTLSCAILSALPERSQISNAVHHKGVLHGDIAKPDYIRLCLSRGVDYTNEFPDFWRRATEQRDPDVLSLLMHTPRWAKTGLTLAVNLHGNSRKKHADFVGAYICAMVRDAPEAASSILDLQVAAHKGHAVLLMLSAGAVLPDPDKQAELEAGIDNHKRLTFFRHGTNIAALCRDIPLLQKARDHFC